MLDGKWLWVWYWDGQAAAAAAAAGAAGVLVKAGDGATPWAQFAPAAARARGAGLRCAAWQYCYGEDLEGELAVAAAAVAAGAQAVVLDCEYEWIGADPARAAALVTGARGLGVPVGVTTDLRIAFANRWPQADAFVPEAEPFPWAALRAADWWLPQLYWTDFRVPAPWVVDLVARFEAGAAQAGWPRPRLHPVLPGGAAAEDLARVAAALAEAGAEGISLWRWGVLTSGALEALGEWDMTTRIAELVNLLGYLQGDVADALERAADDLERYDPAPKTPNANYLRRQEARQALRAAIATLRRGGDAA